MSGDVHGIEGMMRFAVVGCQLGFAWIYCKEMTIEDIGAIH